MCVISDKLYKDADKIERYNSGCVIFLLVGTNYFLLQKNKEVKQLNVQAYRGLCRALHLCEIQWIILPNNDEARKEIMINYATL
jgi:hypothetical protein